ncbi:MAG: cell division protein FtsB [Gammaproteobacteria bacterium]
MRLLLLTLAGLLALLQYDLWFGESSLPDLWQLQQSIEQQRQDNQILKERNDSLEAEVTDLKQGLHAIEERARSELGMIKEGEVFIQVVD